MIDHIYFNVLARFDFEQYQEAVCESLESFCEEPKAEFQSEVECRLRAIIGRAQAVVFLVIDIISLDPLSFELFYFSSRPAKEVLLLAISPTTYGSWMLLLLASL